MTLAALFAFLHHLAAFGMVAALTAEFVLLKGDHGLRNVRRLQVADIAYGLSAGLLLVFGLLRVFYFEKGADYYFHSIPFITKFSLFVLVALLSLYPTVVFLSWRPALRQQQVPAFDDTKRKRIRAIIHFELVGVTLIILCAVLMARGVGFIGGA